ncbi:hypothetical protein KAZ82_00330 [Candidatus Babeliales bacterium]|nr:hypothetical protein [Candidatus Babeliales bacterium]
MKKIMIPALLLMSVSTTTPWSALELLGLKPKAGAVAKVEPVVAASVENVTSAVAVAASVEPKASEVVVAKSSWKKYVPGCPVIVSRACNNVVGVVKKYPKTSVIATVAAVVIAMKILESFEDAEEALF